MEAADYYSNLTTLSKEEKALCLELGVLCSNLTGPHAWTYSDNSTASSLSPSSGEFTTTGYALLLTMAVLGLTLNIIFIFIGVLTEYFDDYKIQLVNIGMADLLTAAGLLIMFAGHYSLVDTVNTVGLVVYWTALQASILCNTAFSLELIVDIFGDCMCRKVHIFVIVGLLWLFATLGSIPLISQIAGSIPVWLYITQSVIYYALPSIVVTIANIGTLVTMKCQEIIYERNRLQQTCSTYRNLRRIYEPPSTMLSDVSSDSVTQ